MTVPGEGYVDKGNLHYFGKRPFVENGEFKSKGPPCEHAVLVREKEDGTEIWQIPLSYVIFIGHPEEYKTQGYCVHCAIAFLMRTQGETEGIP